jgi:hypothetical protein
MSKGGIMYLKKITLIVIIAIISSFSIRTFGTIFPQIFKNVFIVKATILVNTFFILSHLLFWIIFYTEYASTKNAFFKKICLLPIIGSLSVSFLYIKKLPFVFEANVNFPQFLMNPYVDAFVPFISSIFSLIFFVVFRKSTDSGEKEFLQKPILSMIFGILIFLCLHLIVIFNFFTTKRLEWLEHMPRIVAVGTVPLMIIAVILILIFYCKFYYYLDSVYKTRPENHCSS